MEFRDDHSDCETAQGDTRTRVELSDTSPKASKVYFDRLAALSPAERGFERRGIFLQRAAIRRQYPDADEAEVCFHMAVIHEGG